MIPRHLTGYHMLWITFGAVLFLENRLVSQNISKYDTQSEFTAAGISMFHTCICRLQCAIVRSHARCAAAPGDQNTMFDQ